MMPVPAPRLVTVTAVAAAASFATLTFADAWMPLLALNGLLVLLAVADLLATPGANRLLLMRPAPDPLTVLKEQSVAVHVRNRSGMSLWVRVRGGTAGAKAEARARFLAPLLASSGAATGHLPEIADAEPPHAPRGCPFQAWSVAEMLRLDRVVLAV